MQVQGTKGMWATVNRLNTESPSLEKAGKLGGDLTWSKTNEQVCPHASRKGQRGKEESGFGILLT